MMKYKMFNMALVVGTNKEVQEYISKYPTPVAVIMGTMMTFSSSLYGLLETRETVLNVFGDEIQTVRHKVVYGKELSDLIYQGQKVWDDGLTFSFMRDTLIKNLVGYYVDFYIELDDIESYWAGHHGDGYELMMDNAYTRVNDNIDDLLWRYGELPASHKKGVVEEALRRAKVEYTRL